MRMLSNKIFSYNIFIFFFYCRPSFGRHDATFLSPNLVHFNLRHGFHHLTTKVTQGYWREWFFVVREIVDTESTWKSMVYKAIIFSP